MMEKTRQSSVRLHSSTTGAYQSLGEKLRSQVPCSVAENPRTPQNQR